MKKFISILLCSILLSVAVCLPAEARTTIGLAPGTLPAKTSQTMLDALAKELSSASGAATKLRYFEDEATLSNWLLRFQQIDAAIVDPDFISGQPAGTLKHLIDLHPAVPGKTSFALAVRSNASSSFTKQLQEAFIKLNESDSGLNALQKIGFAGATLPGKQLVKKAVQTVKPAAPEPTSPAVTVKKEPKAPAAKTAKPAPITTDAAKAASKAKAVETVAPAKEKAPQAPATLRTEVVAPADKPKKPAPVITKTPVEPPEPKAAEPVQPEKEMGRETVTDKPVISEPAPAMDAGTTEPKASPQTLIPPDKPVQPIAEDQPKPAKNKRLIIFIGLILLVVIIIKGLLFAMRWQSKQRQTLKAQSTPAIETVLEKGAHVIDEVAEDASADEPLVVESGVLGPGKVPELLKRCADLPEPVILQVTKGACEKLVHFAGGQVSSALTQNSTAVESGVRWNKLGSLLIREKLITSEDRDRGMALLTKEPGLRFGEALLKLGLIDLAGLRHALTRQAKVTIYSLILFPEGRYRVVAENGALPPEESVSLEVTNLIREASSHQSEWTAIRQALPNLNKKLEFCAGGEAKLAKVSLAPQQEATLALVNGKRTINDLCAESTMMDYEVYRFLYLMVKADVIH